MSFPAQLWPPVLPRTLTRQVWDAHSARKIPGVGRALGVFGMAASCSLLHVKGDQQLDRTRLLQRPDPDLALATWLGVHLEDYLLHGNAAHLVTAVDSYGLPAATRWYPATAWTIGPDADNQPRYLLYGKEVPRERVVHAQRGADPAFPHRGVGVVEQHLGTFDRAGLEEAAEAANLRDRGMPSVAIIKPGNDHDPVNDDAVAERWVERFKGQDPKPGIFPKDTVITPLSWNPSDAQMVEARKMTLTDVSNAFNLDGYWLGAEGSSYTYRSPGPMFLSLLRVSLNPVLTVLEDVWSNAWMPWGRGARFDRTELLRDDLKTMMTTFSVGVRSGIFDVDEARRYMGWAPLTPEQLEARKPPPQLQPSGDAPPADDQQPNPDPEAAA